MRGTVEERFWAKVDKSGDCWTWTAARFHNGYGMFHVPGRPLEAAHRVAWRFTHGDIPEGMFICHRCDNPPCVRLDHLFIGTHTDNQRDMVAKGRHVSPRRVLTADQVAEIRRRAATGETSVSIAADFPVVASTVRDVIHRRPRRAAARAAHGG